MPRRPIKITNHLQDVEQHLNGERELLAHGDGGLECLGGLLEDGLPAKCGMLPRGTGCVLGPRDVGGRRWGQALLVREHIVWS